MLTFRDYQKDIINKGVDIINQHRFLYLAMEVRTGKTLTSLGIAEKIKGVENVLFITKKKAISSIARYKNLCGFDNRVHPKLTKDRRIYKNDLYLDFVDEYPDYAHRGKSSISRNEFGKWLESYGEFKDDITAITGRDQLGRWIEFESKKLEHANV